jgi:hypothetical protein
LGKGSLFEPSRNELRQLDSYLISIFMIMNHRYF